MEKIQKYNFIPLLTCIFRLTIHIFLIYRNLWRLSFVSFCIKEPAIVFRSVCLSASCYGAIGKTTSRDVQITGIPNTTNIVFTKYICIYSTLLYSSLCTVVNLSMILLVDKDLPTFKITTKKYNISRSSVTANPISSQWACVSVDIIQKCRL